MGRQIIAVKTIKEITFVSKRNFISELKRRNVIRMAGLYLVGAWLVAQIAETLLPVFHTPEWVLQTLIVLLPLVLFQL